jgi:putative DNA primase/helicase
MTTVTQDHGLCNESAIPEALRVERRWIVWHYQAREKSKPAKAPSYNAKANDSRTWLSLDEANALYSKQREPGGIGFVLGDGFVGIDADNCYDPETF